MAMASRKRFQEALKALKQACKNEKLPFTQRIRAAELIMLIYGLQLGEGNKRDRQDVRSLIEQDSFTAALREQLQQKSRADAVQAAKQFLADNADQGDEGNEVHEGGGQQ